MRFPSIAALVALTALTAGATTPACSSKQGGGNTDTADNGGVDTSGGAGQPQGHDTNPYGVPYPTKNIGRNARGTSGATVNTQPGSVMQNFKFLGYPKGDKSKGLQTVALADFFDPEMRQYKVVHLVVAGVWCNPCNQETDALVAALNDPAQAWDKKGVAFVQALGDGPIEGQGATQGDLDRWIDSHKVNFTDVLDPEVKQLGQFFDAAAIPWNADLDARTMEILDAGVGYEDPGNVQQWLDWVANNPPTKY